MQKEAFNWNSDEDQAYDGYVYGSMTLSDRPFSAFSKTLGKSFKMQGDEGDSLTLVPDLRLGDPLAIWGKDPSNTEASLSRISIDGGTLVLRSERDVNAPNPYDEGVLIFGGENPPSLQTVLINVRGRFLVEDTNVEGQGQNEPGLEPCAMINVYPGGVLDIGQTRPDLPAYWTGAYTITIHNFGAMSVTTNIVSLNDGKCLVQGVPPEEGDLSLDITVLPSSNPNSGKGGPGAVGSLTAARQVISCRSTARARLQAPAMYYSDTRIRVEESSGMFIECDAIDLDSDTVFSLGHGSAAITFDGTNGGRAPFEFLDKDYPEGIFNFITTEGPNVGRLRFRGIGSAFEFAMMIQKNLITIDGIPESQSPHQCTWTREGDTDHFNDSYFVVFLKPTR